MSKTYNPYDNVLKVVSEAAGILGYSDSDIEALKYPERELKVAIPVRMDDGARRYSKATVSSIPLPADLPKEESASIRMSIRMK